MWAERSKLNDEPETGMRVAAYSVDNDVMKIVVDYAGTASARRRKAHARQDRCPHRVVVVAFEHIEKSRVAASEFGTEATG